MIISFRKALRDLTRRRLRSFLTIIGIVIGVAGLVAITSTSKNMTAAQEAAYSNNSQQDMRWAVQAAPGSLEAALEQIPNVDAAELRANYLTKWTPGGECGEAGAGGDCSNGEAWRDIRFHGVRDFGNMRVNKIELVEGRWPGRGEVALDASIRDVVPVRIGDLLLYRAGEGNQTRRITVVGFARSPSYPSATIVGTAVGYTLNTEVQRMYGVEGDNQLLVRLRDFSPGERTETRGEIERALAKRNLPFSGYFERNPDDYVGKRQLDALVVLMTVFSVVGLVISSFLVANTLAAVISEQMGEIGAMKAMGAVGSKVVAVYVIGGAIYGVVGTVVGLLVGIFGGHALLVYLGSLFNLNISEIRVDMVDVLQGVAVGVGVTTLAALVPAWRGTAITVRKALDNYGITATYGQGWLDRLAQRLRGLPRMPAMSVRNLARRKGRNLITVGAIALATGAFLAAQSTTASVTLSIENAYAVYGSDAWIWFQTPVGQQFASTLRSIPEVRQVEPWASRGAEVGPDRVTMWGMPPDTGLYNYKGRMKAGRWLDAMQPYGAVISSRFAEVQSLEVGARLELVTAGRSAWFTVLGVVDDNAQGLQSSSRGKVFVPMETAARLTNSSGSTLR